MACKLCGSGATSRFGKHEQQQTFCHDCEGHEYKGLLVNKKDWERWVCGHADQLVGQPVVQQLELIPA